MAQSYSNPKLKLVIDDGFEYLKNHCQDGCFDVIITDSSDPEGPAECLFKQEFYQLLHKRLKPIGIMCCQAESFWFDLEFIVTLMEMNREIFEQVAYASCLTCTYPSGQIGFLVCSKSSAPQANSVITTTTSVDYVISNEEKQAQMQFGRNKLREKPQLTDWLVGELQKLNLKYYSLEAHQAAFVLPQFVENKLYSKTQTTQIEIESNNNNNNSINIDYNNKSHD